LIDNKTPEDLTAEIFNSPKIKKALKLSFIAGIVICVILLLPGIQKNLASLIGTNSPSLLSLPAAALVVLIFGFCCLYAKNITELLDNPKNLSLIYSITIAATLAALGYIGVFSYQRGWQWLDSDHASEMILGKILAEENTLVSSGWRYSTELRLIYQTLFTMPLFKLLGRLENWALIRSLNILLNNLVLLMSYVFMMKQMKVQVKWILLSGIFLLMPLSYDFWNIVTFGGYYIFFIAQLFFFLGLYLKLCSYTGTAKTLLPFYVLFLALSFALGAQGVRTLYVIHIPLLITCIRSQKKYPLLLGCSALAACFAGLAVNYLLHYRYHFVVFENTRMENPANYFSKFGQSLAALPGFFGLSWENPLLSAGGFFSIAGIIGTFMLFWAVIKNLRGHQFLPAFFLASAVCNIFIFIISGKSITSRYFIPFMVLYIPLAALLFEHAERAYCYVKRTALVSGIVLLICGKAWLNFQDLAVRDTNTVRNGYIQYLLDERLEFGFATFWNANVSAELSNGKIETAALETVRGSAGRRQFQIHNYLIPNKFYNPLYHPGESFLLLSRDEWDMISNRGRTASAPKPDYEDGNFIIIRYPSSEAIHSIYINQR